MMGYGETDAKSSAPSARRIVARGPRNATMCGTLPNSDASCVTVVAGSRSRSMLTTLG